MNTQDFLSNHFLVAMPSLVDTTFAKSVIYICEHSEDGAMGVLINKPMPINLGNVLQHLGIKVKNHNFITLPVLMGGPVGQEHGFILYQNQIASLENHPPKQDDFIEISASKEMLEKIAQGKGPASFIVTLGYAGWGKGQLESEIARNDWLIVPADSEIIFNCQISDRWRLAAQKIGVDIDKISSHTGHA